MKTYKFHLIRHGLTEANRDGRYIGTTDLVYIATFKGKPTVTPNNPDIEIPDEEVPLALLPMTGDASALWMALSALSGAGLFLTRKKRDEE